MNHGPWMMRTMDNSRTDDGDWCVVVRNEIWRLEPTTVFQIIEDVWFEFKQALKMNPRRLFELERGRLQCKGASTGGRSWCLGRSEAVKLGCDTNLLAIGHPVVYHGPHSNNTPLVRTPLIGLHCRTSVALQYFHHGTGSHSARTVWPSFWPAIKISKPVGFPRSPLRSCNKKSLRVDGRTETSQKLLSVVLKCNKNSKREDFSRYRNGRRQTVPSPGEPVPWWKWKHPHRLQRHDCDPRRRVWNVKRVNNARKTIQHRIAGQTWISTECFFHSSKFHEELPFIPYLSVNLSYKFYGDFTLKSFAFFAFHFSMNECRRSVTFDFNHNLLHKEFQSEPIVVTIVKD